MLKYQLEGLTSTLQQEIQPKPVKAVNTDTPGSGYSADEVNQNEKSDRDTIVLLGKQTHVLKRRGNNQVTALAVRVIVVPVNHWYWLWSRC